MTRLLSAVCVALALAGLAGCQGKPDGAGSADPHHYTAAEARAAYMQRMGGGGARPGVPPPHVATSPNGAPGKTNK